MFFFQMGYYHYYFRMNMKIQWQLLLLSMKDQEHQKSFTIGKWNNLNFGQWLNLDSGAQQISLL